MNLIIMVCRNGLALSRPCLRSLQAQTDIGGKRKLNDLSILIVDNASSDGTAAWARSEQAKDPEIHRMTVDAVQSVATLWNRALTWAWSHGAKEALVVNNDTELVPETFDVLHCYSLNTLTALNDGWGMITCVSRRTREDLVYNLDRDLTYRDHPDFSCFMLTKEAYEKTGPFDEGFVGAYFEDNDYHVRMHRAGVIARCIDLPFLHHGSGTLNHATAEERRRIESNAALNKQRFFHKYGCYPGTKKYEALFTREDLAVSLDKSSGFSEYQSSS